MGIPTSPSFPTSLLPLLGRAHILLQRAEDQDDRYRHSGNEEHSLWAPGDCCRSCAKARIWEMMCRLTGSTLSAEMGLAHRPFVSTEST